MLAFGLLALMHGPNRKCANGCQMCHVEGSLTNFRPRGSNQKGYYDVRGKLQRGSETPLSRDDECSKLRSDDAIF